MIQLWHQIIHFNLGRTYGRTVKTFALSSGNVSKYEFLTGKDVLPEKDLLEKAATLKRFEYSPLGSELKKQTSVAEKAVSNTDKIYESDETINKESTPKKYNKSDPIYNTNHSFYKH